MIRLEGNTCVKEGDRKEVRSAYSKQSGSTDKDLAIEFRTDSFLQVYHLCSKCIWIYDML